MRSADRLKAFVAQTLTAQRKPQIPLNTSSSHVAVAFSSPSEWGMPAKGTNFLYKMTYAIFQELQAGQTAVYYCKLAKVTFIYLMLH